MRILNWRSERLRYTVFGAFFGVLFPVIAFFTITFVSRDIYILFGVICTAPFFLGFVSRFAGLRQDRLNEVNQGLEQLVAERTSSIQSMLDLSGQGFLTIGSDLIVQPEYSKECERIFDGPIQGRKLDELLYSDSEASSEFVKGLGLCFAGSAKPDVIFDLLDHEFRIHDKIVHAEYRAVTDERVMVTLSDVTEELRLQKRVRAEDERNARLLRAIRHKADFGSFVNDAEQILSHLEGPPSNADALAREVHTFKANAGFFGFHRTQEVAHELEDYIADSSILEQELSFDGRMDRLRGAFADEMRVVTGTLGPDWVSETDSVVVPRRQYLRIESHVALRHPSDHALLHALADQRKHPIAQLFARFPQMAMDLALQRGKQVRPVEINGGGVRVLLERYESLVSSFSHLIRNMVDHGIEAPAERERAGKHPAGSIRIDISGSEEEIVFRFSDDGRGIDLELVEKRARELGLVKPAEKPQSARLIQYIFHSKFSTASNVTLVSGRGFGLSAVRETVRALGGKINIATRAGKGTSFTISIPGDRQRSNGK